MIDKTLARMIDETLQRCRNPLGFGMTKLLEVRANRAHLMDSAIRSRQLLQLQGFRS
jgi:hypothetical protein